jgi:hypothetical protein
MPVSGKNNHSKHDFLASFIAAKALNFLPIRAHHSQLIKEFKIYAFAAKPYVSK